MSNYENKPLLVHHKLSKKKHQSKIDMMIDDAKEWAKMQSCLEFCKYLSIGDILVLVRKDGEIEIGPYGTPRKYQVVGKCTQTGIAYVCELGLKDVTSHAMFAQPNISSTTDEPILHQDGFKLDREYEDAILTGTVESFDPMASAKEAMLRIKKAVDFNKSIKLNCNSSITIRKQVKDLGINSIIWTSSKHYFIVKEIYDTHIIVATSKNITKEFMYKKLVNKHLYSQQPMLTKSEHRHIYNE